MNICFLLPPIERYSPVSGGAIATKTMQKGRRLIARGHDVTVVAARCDDAPYPVGRYVPIDCPTRQSLNIVQRAISRIRRNTKHWDWLYYDHYLASARHALRRLTPKPDAVLVFNDLITPRYVRRELPQAKVLCMLSNECATNQPDIRKTVAAVHKFVTVSHYIEDWTKNRYGIAPEKIMTIPNGADLETFTPRPGYLDAPSTIKALFIGRIDRNKGPDLAADAIIRLRREGVPISLTVAGGLWFYDHGNESADPFFCTLREKIQSAEGEYVGHVTRPNVPGLIRRHDVACILSRSNDPMPQTAFEAMASGLAIVASNRGGIPEACNGAAWLVDPDEPEAILSALRTLATIPPVLNEYKRRSAVRAGQATWDVNVEALEKVLLN
jgi:glycosyltransferase involved in cell wall biosynthesis